MNHISIFLNNRIDTTGGKKVDYPAAFGDWCLTPVRCLFNGNKVTLSNSNGQVTVDHSKDYDIHWRRSKKDFLRVVASVVLLVPGLIIGCAVKGLTYVFPSIRQRHQLAVEHYTPVNRVIGTPDERLDLEGIKKQLFELRKNNPLNQPADNVIIYAKEGTEIQDDPGILRLNPKKLILIGAKLVNGPSSSLFGCLDEQLSPKWETNTFRVISHKETETVSGSFSVQHKMDSLVDALDDIPPRISKFSSERYHRIYVISDQK